MKSTGIKSHTSHRLSALGLLVTIGIVFVPFFFVQVNKLTHRLKKQKK